MQVWSLQGGANGARAEEFRAKGNKPNRIGLVDLPHITALTFMPDPDGQRVMAGTAEVSRAHLARATLSVPAVPASVGGGWQIGF